jgi:hypothetical protein
MRSHIPYVEGSIIVFTNALTILIFLTSPVFFKDLWPQRRAGENAPPRDHLGHPRQS